MKASDNPKGDSSMARIFTGDAEALADTVSEIRSARRGAGEPILVVEDDPLTSEIMV